MKKSDLVKKLVELHDKGEEWLNALPASISQCFFENEYVDCEFVKNTLLMKALFKDDYEMVTYLLYEWAPGLAIEDENPRTIEEAIECMIKYWDFKDDEI